jgi:hypothetical protein
VDARTRLGLAGLIVAVLTAAALAVGDAEEPEAVGVHRFADCADLSASVRSHSGAATPAVTPRPARAGSAVTAHNRLAVLRHPDRPGMPDELHVVDLAGRSGPAGLLRFALPERAHEVIAFSSRLVLVLGAADDDLGDAVLTLVDVSGPRPVAVRRATFTGTYVSADAAGGRVVLAGRPADVLPAWEIRDRHGSVVTPGPLLGCTDVIAPTRGAAAGILTILQIDAVHGSFALERARAFGLLAPAGLIRFTAGQLYVGVPGDDGRTDLHALTPDGGHFGSGTTVGHIAGPEALSAGGGNLYVVTAADSDESASASGTSAALTVLSLHDRRLVEVGRIDGLRTGAGLDGPGVTPYLLDLADPARPRITARPALDGYTGSLFPAGDGFVLAATATGGMPHSEIRLIETSGRSHGLTVHNAKAIGSGPYAFDQNRRLALVPARTEAGGKTENLVLGVRIAADGGLREVGRFRTAGEILHVVPHGDRIIVVTDSSVAVLATADLGVLRTVRTGS